jgi:hypothetical protein
LQRPDSSSGFQKRLVVNPFLVVLDWLVALAILRASIARFNFRLFQVGTILLVLGFLLVQYHCLDCGATGWVLRHRRHACPEDVVRWRNRRPRHWRVPSVGTQIVVWCNLLATAVLLWLILR